MKFKRKQYIKTTSDEEGHGRELFIPSSLPAEHHDGGLRVGAGRVPERGAVDDAEPLDADDPVVPVDDAPDVAAAVVVPDGHHRVPAVLLQRPRVPGVPRQQVHREVCRPGGAAEGGVHGGVVGVGEAREGPRPHHPLDGLDAPRAPLHVPRVPEVVERHGGVGVRVRRPQLDVPRRQRAQHLLQDEAAPERAPVQPPHHLRRAPHRLRRPLLGRHRAQLPRLLHWIGCIHAWRLFRYHEGGAAACR